MAVTPVLKLQNSYIAYPIIRVFFALIAVTKFGRGHPQSGAVNIQDAYVCGNYRSRIYVEETVRVRTIIFVHDVDFSMHAYIGRVLVCRSSVAYIIAQHIAKTSTVGQIFVQALQYCLICSVFDM